MQKTKSKVVELICSLLVLLFMYAAVSKWLDVQKFQVQVGQSPLLSRFAIWIVWLIPSVEIAVSLLLTFERTRLLGLYASFFLMVLFSAYIIAITRFSSYVPCSCGGVLQHLSWNQHLVFNLGFAAMSLAGILLQAGSPAPYSNPKGAVSAG